MRKLTPSHRGADSASVFRRIARWFDDAEVIIEASVAGRRIVGVVVDIHDANKVIVVLTGDGDFVKLYHDEVTAARR